MDHVIDVAQHFFTRTRWKRTLLRPPFATRAGNRRRPMSAVLLAAFGWLVPGGAYLLMRRYLQFAVFAFVVWATFAAGLALHGGCGWPQPADLAGLDTVHRTGSSKPALLRKLLAGGPYLVAQLFDGSSAFLRAACTSMEPRCW